jgi:hypothetical protein
MLNFKRDKQSYSHSMSRSAEQQQSGATEAHVPPLTGYRNEPYNSNNPRFFVNYPTLFMGHINFTVLEADLTRHIAGATGLEPLRDFAVTRLLRLNGRRSKGSCFISVHPDHAETLLSLNGRMDLPFAKTGLALVVEQRCSRPAEG